MTELPLFPLHAVLCPGIALPLHVFEPRYRAMISRCLAAGSPFGIVRIRAGREVGMVQPELEQIGTIAEIRDSERHADGRFDLVVVGVGRIRIGERRSAPGGYLVAEVETLEEQVGDADRSRSLVADVSQRFIRYLELLRPAEGETGPELELELEVEVEGEADVETDVPDEGSEGPTSTFVIPVDASRQDAPPPLSAVRDARLDEIARRLALPDDPTAFSHLISGIVQVEASRRQALLEAPSAEVRLERLRVLLRQEILFLDRRLAAFIADPRSTLLRRN